MDVNLSIPICVKRLESSQQVVLRHYFLVVDGRRVKLLKVDRPVPIKVGLLNNFLPLVVSEGESWKLLGRSLELFNGESAIIISVNQVKLLFELLQI